MDFGKPSNTRDRKIAIRNSEKEINYVSHGNYGYLAYRYPQRNSRLLLGGIDRHSCTR